MGYDLEMFDEMFEAEPSDIGSQERELVPAWSVKFADMMIEVISKGVKEHVAGEIAKLRAEFQAELKQLQEAQRWR